MASSSLIQGRGGAAGTTIAALHSDIIETHLLTKFDGPSLASAASTCQLLTSLCNKQSLWEHICSSTWESIQHPLVRQTISSFPGGYRSFYSDSFPVVRPNMSQEISFHRQVHSTELISAIDMHLGNKPVYSKVRLTNTSATGFLGSSFCVDLIEHKESVEIPLKYQGDDKECMSRVEESLTLSWIVIDPTLKRAANVSSLSPVSVRPHWDGNGIKVIYATVVSGGIDTTKFVECRIVAIFGFGCEEGKMLQLKELSLCVVDMVSTRLNGDKSLRILEGVMESGDRKKQNGDAKEMYGKYLDFKRNNRDEKKRRVDRVYRVLWLFHAIIWVFFAISLISSLLWFA